MVRTVCLTAQPSSAADFRLGGVVVSSTEGSPISGVHVTIENVERKADVQSVSSGDDGHFEFRVRPGRYAVWAQKPGYVSSFYNEHEGVFTRIVTGTGLDTSHISFRMSPAAVISGRVLDESDEPVQDAIVTLFEQRNRTGRGRVFPFMRWRTDAEGAFEFAPLKKGTYFLSVTARPWYAVYPISSFQPYASLSTDTNLDVVYQTTYYGGAFDAADAAPILLSDGRRLDVIFNLTPANALHLFLHAPDNGLRPGEPTLKLQAFNGTDDGSDAIQPSAMEEVSPGIYEITGVAPGRYHVSIRVGGKTLDLGETDLMGNGQQLDLLPAAVTSVVSGKVHWLGGGNVPSHLRVGLIENRSGRPVVAALTSREGNFEVQSVPPGSYEVVVYQDYGVQDYFYCVSSIAVGGSETTGHTLLVSSGSAMSVVVSFLKGLNTVTGVATQHKSLKAGAMVLLAPEDPENNLNLYRRNQSDTDGGFAFHDVVPGKYKVIAIDDGWDLDFGNAAVVRYYSTQAQELLVEKNVPATLRLSKPVVVQSRIN